MDTSLPEELSPRQSSIDRPVVTQFDPGTTPTPTGGTLREHDSQLQELRRENFNLKLRIFFLEENSSVDPFDRSPRAVLSSRYPSQHDIFNSFESPRARSSSQDPFRSRFSPTRHSPQNLTDNVSSDDQPGPLNRFDINENPLSSNDPNMSNHSSSSHIQLNDYKRREQKLVEERNALERQLKLCENQSEKAGRDWENRRREYEDEIHQLREQELKQKRVVEQLKKSYDAEIARLRDERQKLLADQESYRHEPLLARIRFSYPLQDASSLENINADDFHRMIRDRERTIEELRTQLRSVNRENPTGTPDPRVRNLEKQVQKYQDDIARLQSECDRLRRDEVHLRNQITDLTRIVDSVGTSALPPRPPQSPTTLTQLDPVQDPQKAVVQMSLQLRNDAENLTTANDRVQQIVRERDELKRRVRDVDALKQQFDQREEELRTRVEEKYKVQVEMLRTENEDLKNQSEALKVRVREINEKLRQEQTNRDEILDDLQKRNRQERQNLLNEIDRKQDRINQLESELTKTLGEKLDLDDSNGQLATRQDERVEQMENQIETLHQQIHNFERERERARDVQNQVDELLKERNELRTELDQLKTTIEDEQQRVEGFRRDLDRQRQNIETLTEENEQLNQQNQKLERQTRDLRSRSDEIEQLNQQIDQLEENNRRAQTEIEDWKQRFDMKENENQRLRDQIDSQGQQFVAESDQLRKDMDDLEVRIRLQIDEKYQEELERSRVEKEKQIERLNEENRGLSDTVQQLENQLRTLKEQNEENLLRIQELVQLNERTREQLDEQNQRAKEEIQLAYDDGRKQADEQNERIREEIQRAYDDGRRQTSEQNERLKEEIQRAYEDGRKQATEQNERLKDEIQRAYEDGRKQATEQNERIKEEIQHAYEDGRRQANEHNERTQRALEEDLRSLENRNQQLENELRAKTDEIARSSRSDTQVSTGKSSSNYQRLNKSSVTVIETIQTSGNDEKIEKLQAEINEKNLLIEKLRNALAAFENEAENTRIKLRIRIEELEGDLDNKRGSIQSFTDEIQRKEEQIRELRDNLNQTTLNERSSREEYLQQIDRREEIIQKQESTFRDREEILRQYREQLDRRNLEIVQLTEDLRNAQVDQNQFEVLREENERLQINLRITVEEKDEQIRTIENDLEMSKVQQNAQNTLINDLENELKRRTDQIEGLRLSNQKYEEELNRVRQTPTKPVNYVPRPQPPLPTQQSSSPAESNRTIETLRQEIERKDRQIKQFQQSNSDLQEQFNQLAMKNSDQNQELARLKQDINRLQQENRQLNDEVQRLRQQPRADPNSTSSRSTVTTVISQPKGRRELEAMTREDLMYELEQANERNRKLSEQLTAKSPNVTALHHQIGDVRRELERQQYVNQVLWRKVNVCMDVHINGANTRAELTQELANYQDEVAKLKTQQIHFDEKRASIPTVHSTSSENNLSFFHQHNEIPSKNIKSTIALLERSNIEWQTKVARLTERLGRSESESRNYQRDLSKCQKLLHQAGLFKYSERHRRRSADDSNYSFEIYSSEKIHDEFEQIENLDELKQILRRQKQFLQQLQMQIRLNTPDLIQSTTIDKLNDEIRNLTKVIETYKTESNLVEKEMKKLYKTIEKDRTTLEQYENLIKDQQKFIERSTNKLKKYEDSAKKTSIHVPIWREDQIPIVDDFLIDLDIDISDESANRQDSGFHSAQDANEYQRQINDKDEQIQQLKRLLTENDAEVKRLATLLRNRPQTTNGNERDQQNEIQDLRRQINESNRFREENQQLQNELAQLRELLNHHKREIRILEEQVKHPSGKSSADDDISIRRIDLAELLDEMRNLRRNLEISINKQNELQLKLDENLRQSRTPREFTFSGRGVSYPDLRLTEGAGAFNVDNLSPLTISDERRSRPAGLSATELDPNENERLTNIPTRQYALSEVQTYENIRRYVEDIKFNLKALTPALEDRGRLTQTTADRLRSLDECLNQTLNLLEQFWKSDLPEKNQYDEHPFVDVRLVEENKRLLAVQRRYAQDVEHLRRKYKEQANLLDQVLAQLTKANRKKAETGDYLALLLRPTLDALQKARTNIEHHLKESHSPPRPSTSNSQSARHHRRRHHQQQQQNTSTNHHD